MGSPNVSEKGSKSPRSSSNLVQGQTFLPGTKEQDVMMDQLISSFVHRGGRNFNIVEDPGFAALIRHARLISKDYKPPNRKQIAGKLLDVEYDYHYKTNLKLLANEAETFGLALYADGATIAKTPFINILASGIHKTNACLDIHDCSMQMADGGKKMLPTFTS
jgi:hypothetical protein